MATTRPCAARGGVILLVVLGVLAMFGLLALAFVLVAMHHQRVATIAARTTQSPDNPESTLDEAFYQVARGTQNPNSVLRPHSLLEDMYGNRGVTSALSGAPASIAGGQILQFGGAGIATPLDYVGRVLTFTSGGAQGYSTRIIGYSGTALQIVAQNWSVAPAEGDKFVINGRDFGGTGAGYNTATGQLDVAVTVATTYGTFPCVLTPNPTLYPAGQDPAGDGGANEGYDAPDYQNMLLAMTSTSSSVGVIIPSLHRSSLVLYSQLHLADTNAHNALLRPTTADHPNFNGSNPNFSATWDGVTNSGYRWDVDNDGDGIPDSIWGDLGMPVRTAPDGRLYKPLYAILCTDLDGRLNLNAHGSLTQTAASYYSGITAPNRTVNPAWQPYFANGSTAASLPRGQGFGPADVNLGPLCGNGDLAGDATLQAAYAAVLTRRYGSDGVPGQAASGIFNGDDPLSQNLSFQYWNECWRESTQFLNLPPSWTYDYWKYFTDPANYLACGYGTPFDRKAKGAVGLDVRGAPIYPQMCDTTDHIDDPYELNLFSNSGADQPFTVAELERVLRRFDRDSNQLPLPSALNTLLNLPNHQTDVTKEVTTHSFDVPVAGLRLPADLRSSMTTTWGSISPATQIAIRSQLKSTIDPSAADATLVDLLIVRLASDLDAKGQTNIPAKIAALLPRLLPIELGMGLKMDLNRPFGNGLDDNGNGVVDEPARVLRNTAASPRLVLDPNYPGEITLPNPKLREKMPQLTAAAVNITDAVLEQSDGIDVDGDGSITDADRAMARQLMARQLYVMMLLLTNYQVTTPGSPTPTEKDEARVIAQWAVNVVDFRDRDSIMTPFEYDICPFTDEDGDGDTWDVDGVIGTTANPSADDNEATHPYRGLVWGCERPELLITETLAFHDRATEDLAITGVTNPRTTKPDDYLYSPSDNANVDFDLNQKKRPRGSLFVELYNPWTYEEPPTGELHNLTQHGVDLTRMAPGTHSPVWRLAIFNDPSKAIDPESPPRPERSVYFADISTAAGGIDVPATNDGLQHYPSHPATTPLLPGQYCVVGPGDNDMPAGLETFTYLGLTTNGTLPDSATRRIALPAFSGGSALDIFLNRNGTSDLQALYTTPQINVPLAFAVDKARMTSGNQMSTGNLRLSISETFGGYPVTGYNDPTNFDKTTQVYPAPFPFPLDRFPDPTNVTSDSPLWATLAQDGTFVGFRIIHLQRLANPLQAWDENANPYRTVDVMMVDLTTFNGTPQTPGHLGTDPPPPSPTLVDDISPDHFCSRQRGGNSDLVTENDVWMQERLVNRTLPYAPPPKTSQTTTIDPINPIANHVFTAGLHHTLGYLNWYLNRGYETTGPRDNSLSAMCVGAPRGTPFPWLRWANRPFVSPVELLEVPALGSGRLLANPADTSITSQYPFTGAFSLLTTSGSAPTPFTVETDSFAHLLNFAYSGSSGIFSAASGVTPGKLHRLFDLVEVPSPFVGAELQGNPSKFASTTGHTFYPPFNRIPTWRKPGLVNLNTISSPIVWRGLINYFPDMTTSAANWNNPAGWQAMLANRQGFATNNGTYPTDFRYPFRTAADAQLDPLMAPAREIDATLLRKDLGGNGMLFENDTSGSPVTNARRNPYFRYEELERLSNLATTRSNVYAIWITVGYFEVTPWAPGVDAAHPDGYQLGQELGTETGEIQRHRAFYIFDRSIPVGFQRGENLNVDKAVLLRRFIE